MKWNFFTKKTAQKAETTDKTLNLRLDYLERQLKGIGDMLIRAEENKKENAYLGEVSEIMAALGPAAFRGMVKTCFATPGEVQQIRGENAELQSTLDNATAAMELSTKSIGALTAQYAALAAKLNELSLPENAEESQAPGPVTLVRKMSRAN